MMKVIITFSASTFCSLLWIRVKIYFQSITVKSSFLFGPILLYDVMGDLTPHSLAAKLIKKLNKDSKILSDNFVAGTLSVKIQ